MPLSESRKDVIEVITQVAASVSGVATILVLLTFLFYPNLRTFRTRLIFCISIADLGTIIALIVGTFVTDVVGWCHVAGALLMYFVVASCVWTCCFAMSLFRIVQGDKTVEAYERSFHIAAWGGSALFCIALAILAEVSGGNGVLWGEPFGAAGAWCWIDQDHSIWRLSYIGVMLMLLFNIVIYIRITCTLRHSTTIPPPSHLGEPIFDLDDSFEGSTSGMASLLDEDHHQAHTLGAGHSKAATMFLLESRATRHYLWYIVAFVVVQLPGFVHRMYQFYSYSDSLLQYWLYIVQALTQPAQGFFTFLLYVTNAYHYCLLLGPEKGSPRLNSSERDALNEQMRCIEEQVQLLRDACENLPAAARMEMQRTIHSLEESHERLRRQMVYAEMCQQW